LGQQEQPALAQQPRGKDQQKQLRAGFFSRCRQKASSLTRREDRGFALSGLFEISTFPSFREQFLPQRWTQKRSTLNLIRLRLFFFLYSSHLFCVGKNMFLEKIRTDTHHLGCVGIRYFFVV